MHLNDEQIQRLLHDELEPRARESAAQHVAQCGECARLLAEATREEAAIFDLLGRVDHPAPRVDASAIARRRSPLAVWGRRAAGVAIVVGLAGAAYAIPGSPLPSWLHKVADLIAKNDSSPAPDDRAPAEPVTSGIAVPASSHFRIVFADAPSAGAVALSLVDGSNVVVRARGGTATFTTDVDQLTIGNRDASASYEIDIPRDATRVEIVIGDRSITIKDGDAFGADLPTDAQGRRTLSFAQP